MILRKNMSMDDLRSFAPSIFAETRGSKTSNKYLMIPTANIVDAMIKQDFIPVSAKQTRARDTEHAKHVIHFSHKSIASELRLNEEIPLIRVQNSHDGKSSFQIDTGFFRLVCSNGLVMPGAQFNSARVIHKLGMESDVIEASYRILGSFEKQTQQVQVMKTVELSVEESKILARSAMRLIFEKEQIEANLRYNRPIENTLLAPRRHVDAKTDLWTVFNRVQENVIKGGRRVLNEKGHMSMMREVRSIDREKQINVELMTLAQEMAKLKGHQLAVA